MYGILYVLHIEVLNGNSDKLLLHSIFIVYTISHSLDISPSFSKNTEYILKHVLNRLYRSMRCWIWSNNRVMSQLVYIYTTRVWRMILNRIWHENYCNHALTCNLYDGYRLWEYKKFRGFLTIWFKNDDLSIKKVNLIWKLTYAVLYEKRWIVY